MAINGEMAALWNSEDSEGWSSRPEQYDAMLGELGSAVLDRAGLAPGERVLDVGCGAGQLTLQAAAQVGPTGTVLGLDIAVHLVELANRRGAEAGLSQVSASLGDAQVHDFPAGGFDVVLSRFGVMFFADPVAAFANLRSATTPGGRLAFVAWQAAPLNEWVLVPMMALIPHVGPPNLPGANAPGPFALADSDHVRHVLTNAGWADVAIEDVHTTVSVGGATTAAEAAAFTSDDTFGRMLLAGASPEQRAAAMVALTEAYTPHVTEDGVRLNAAAWLVTCRR